MNSSARSCRRNKVDAAQRRPTRLAMGKQRGERQCARDDGYGAAWRWRPGSCRRWRRRARSRTTERLTNPEPGNWMLYRRTYDGQGYSPLDKINASNVKNLVPVWSFSTGVNEG